MVDCRRFLHFFFWIEFELDQHFVMCYVIRPLKKKIFYLVGTVLKKIRLFRKNRGELILDVQVLTNHVLGNMK